MSFKPWLKDVKWELIPFDFRMDDYYFDPELGAWLGYCLLPHEFFAHPKVQEDFWPELSPPARVLDERFR